MHCIRCCIDLLINECSLRCCQQTQDTGDEAENLVVHPGLMSSALSSSRHCSSSRLKALVQQRHSGAAYKQMLTERQRLPVYQHRDEVVDTFRRHGVFIIAGETGSGKSTQVPQFILEVNQLICYF